MDQNTGPTVEFFETESDKPHVSPGHQVKVSLNGKLIYVSYLAGDKDNPEGRFGQELYGVNWLQFDNLTGRLLTLADATFTDPVQRKAFKDLLRQHIKEWVSDIIMVASEDAGKKVSITVPFVGGVLDQAGGLFGVEGEPTP